MTVLLQRLKGFFSVLLFIALISCSPRPQGGSLQHFQTGSVPTGLDAEGCSPCHPDKYSSFVKTAHFRTSSFPTEETILGDFSRGRNILNTRNPSTYFQMHRRGDAFVQTAYWRVGNELDGSRSRTEQIGVVIGAGIEGQSFLYWKDNFLYQLPVSYFSSINQWVNSPGFPDGEVFFGRPVTPRCLECHGTYFEIEGTASSPKYRKNFQLGITCWKCHGDGGPHIEKHSSDTSLEVGSDIINPAKLPPERQLDLCALCHSGVGQEQRAPFSYRPGQDLATYLVRTSPSSTTQAEEPGGWLANRLFRQSKCFQQSLDATCATCHDVHTNDTGSASMSRKCQQCHTVERCPQFGSLGTGIETLCIDCHMPDQESRRLKVHRTDETLSPAYRNHRIAIYPEATRTTLAKLKTTEPRNP